MDTGSTSQADLRAVIAELRAQVTALTEQLTAAQAQNAALASRVVALEADLAAERTKTPPWVKPHRPRREDASAPRKKRAQNFARQREAPTEYVRHAVDACPDCGCALRGGWVHRRRQVLDIPVVPVRVIEHEIIARRCPLCNKRRLPAVDLSAEVVGAHRVSSGTMSLIASLRSVGRLPVRTIRWYLATFHRLALSVGEIVEVLHTVAARGAAAVAALQAQVRASPVVHGDETSWRQNGQNGWVWSFSTPTVRSFLYRPSRGGEVVTEVLGAEFGGVLMTDFYAAYNRMDGQHAKCWAHLLRDVHDLTEKFPAEADVQSWARAVRDLFAEAVAYTTPDEPARREAARVFRDKLLALCVPLCRTQQPPHTLCERIERYSADLFVFVADPRVPTTNNAAERSLRPVVIGRKISGGTRSDKGSETRMALSSLFDTWRLQGLNPFDQCRQMLLPHQV